ncbi:MAG: hypothetical protein R2744_05620 [Bacteroidales bacterium]
MDQEQGDVWADLEKRISYTGEKTVVEAKGCRDKFKKALLSMAATVLVLVGVTSF